MTEARRFKLAMLIGWATIAVIAGMMLMASTKPAPAFGPLPKAAQCRSLEALGRLAQAKVNAGYQPNARQLADYEARKAWYERNCSTVAGR